LANFSKRFGRCCSELTCEVSSVTTFRSSHCVRDSVTVVPNLPFGKLAYQQELPLATFAIAVILADLEN